jgi:hypothetical protein
MGYGLGIYVEWVRTWLVQIEAKADRDVDVQIDIGSEIDDRDDFPEDLERSIREQIAGSQRDSDAENGVIVVVFVFYSCADSVVDRCPENDHPAAPSMACVSSSQYLTLRPVGSPTIRPMPRSPAARALADKMGTTIAVRTILNLIIFSPQADQVVFGIT